MLQYGQYDLWISGTDVLKQSEYVCQLMLWFPFPYSEGKFLEATMIEPTFSLGVSGI